MDNDSPEVTGLGGGSAALSDDDRGSDLDLDMHDLDVENVATTTVGLVINDDDDDDDDDLSAGDIIEDIHGSQAFLGLGFDPTENMDAVMMSPAQGPSKSSEPAIDLTSLSLDTPASGVGGESGGVPKACNPFASLAAPTTPSQFLGSSTWGTGRSLGGTPLGSLPLGNWDILGASSGVGVETSDKTPSGDGGEERKVASFLSLSSIGENTWGTGAIGLTGLRGAPLGSANSGAETSAHDTD